MGREGDRRIGVLNISEEGRKKWRERQAQQAAADQDGKGNREGKDEPDGNGDASPELTFMSAAQAVSELKRHPERLAEWCPALFKGLSSADAEAFFAGATSCELSGGEPVDSGLAFIPLGDSIWGGSVRSELPPHVVPIEARGVVQPLALLGLPSGEVLVPSEGVSGVVLPGPDEGYRHLSLPGRVTLARNVLNLLWIRLQRVLMAMQAMEIERRAMGLRVDPVLLSVKGLSMSMEGDDAVIRGERGSYWVLNSGWAEIVSERGEILERLVATDPDDGTARPQVVFAESPSFIRMSSETPITRVDLNGLREDVRLAVSIRLIGNLTQRLRRRLNEQATAVHRLRQAEEEAARAERALRLRRFVAKQLPTLGAAAGVISDPNQWRTPTLNRWFRGVAGVVGDSDQWTTTPTFDALLKAGGRQVPTFSAWTQEFADAASRLLSGDEGSEAVKEE